MVIAKTPLRISFFGGGSDYPEALPRLVGGGATLGCVLDKCTYVSANRGSPLNEYRYRVSYSQIEFAEHWDEIRHPAVRECLRFLDFREPVEIYVITDLPSRTGLGSSSSFTVSLLHVLHALRGELMSGTDLAEEAVYVERELIRERVGLQDQFLCALGGFQLLSFASAPVSGRPPEQSLPRSPLPLGATVRHEPVPIAANRLHDLQSRLMLFYTGIRRTAHDLLEEQLQNTDAGRVDRQLQSMRDMVEPAARILCGNEPLDSFGEMLHASWQLKRSLSSRVSNAQIDEAYEQARRHGAVGGKLLGAGGGGFLLLFVPPAKQAAVREGLQGYPEVSLQLGGPGSQLLFAERR